MLQVAGVVGRADLLCALLFILSFLMYVKSCAKGMFVSNHFIVHILNIQLSLERFIYMDNTCSNPVNLNDTRC